MKDKALWILIFTILWYCDGILTTIFVDMYGTKMEANILPRMVLETFGFTGFWVMKIVTWAFWLYVNKLYENTKGKELSYLFEVAMCVVLVPVCLASLHIILG